MDHPNFVVSRSLDEWNNQSEHRPPDRVRIGKLFALFLIQNICCGYSKNRTNFQGFPTLLQ